ncbi:hypothetical protein Ciccas_013793, partial [Cichlidogyrus casuarinus]
MSDFQARILAQAQVWQGDGTFKAAPTSFRQLYQIRCRYRNRAFTVVSTFMTSKSEQAYRRLFHIIVHLRSMNLEILCQTLVIDFEI